MLGALLTFFLVGLVGMLVIGVVLAVVGAVLGLALSLAGLILFKVVPILLVGYLIVRFLTPRHKRLERAERRWIEEG